jgi:hypothetical protein
MGLLNNRQIFMKTCFHLLHFYCFCVIVIDVFLSLSGGKKATALLQAFLYPAPVAGGSNPLQQIKQRERLTLWVSVCSG